MDADDTTNDDLPEPPGVAQGLTREEREEEFLRLISEGVAVRRAATAVALNFSNLYRKRKADAGFAKRWEDATRITVESLEVEAFRRARNCSDKLLMFLLERRAPEKYSNKQEIKHTGGMNLAVFTGIPGGEVDDLL